MMQTVFVFSGERGLSEAMVSSMVSSWLFNRSRFCVKDRNDKCFWGMPSVAADDINFTGIHAERKEGKT